MYFFAFSIFFAFNFSLWFIVPALILKSTVKPGRKRKDEKLNNYLLLYVFITIVYVLIYTTFYKYFSMAIKENGPITNSINYFNNDIIKLEIVSTLFMIISIVQAFYTVVLAKRLFKLKKIDFGYAICLLTGVFNVLSYWFSNIVLKLNFYSFYNNQHLFNGIMKFNYEMSLFIFAFIVFLNFVSYFITEE